MYIQGHSYHQPLNDFFSNKRQPKQQPLPTILWDITPDTNFLKSEVEWPEEVFSFSTPHVSFPEWKATVINPRMFKYQSEGAQELVKSFQKNTSDYYVRIENSVVIPQLHAILRRRLNVQGKHESLNGSKEELIKRIAQSDFMKYARMYGGIREQSKKHVLNAHWEADSAVVHSQINSQRQKLVKGMKGQMESLGDAIFIKILELFRARDESMQKSNDSFNNCTATKNIHLAFKRSYFFHPEASLKIFVLEMFENDTMETIRSMLKDKLTFRAYFPIRAMKSLIVLSVVDNEFLYYNADEKLSMSDVVEMGTEYFNYFKTHIISCSDLDPNQWKVLHHKHCVNWERCGDIALLALIYHISNDLPIFFEKAYLQNFHEVLALSIIEDSLYC